MKFLIGSRRHDSFAKAQEWLSVRHRSVLLDLAAWIKQREQDWGDCVIAIEVDVPGLKHHKASNVDLLIAFRSRVAVCEIKNHSDSLAAAAVLHDSLAQSGRHHDLVKAHLLRQRAVDTRAIRPFLFYPNLDGEAVWALNAEQGRHSSLRQVVIAGGGLCRSGTRDSHDHPLYFVAALDSRLAQMEHNDRESDRAAAAVMRLVKGAFDSEFGDVDALIAFVRQGDDSLPRALSGAPGHIQTSPHEGHRQALSALTDWRTLEIIGGVHTGKTDFLRDVLAEYFRRSSHRIPLFVCDVRSEFDAAYYLRLMLRHLDVDVSTYAKTDDFIALLLSTSGVVWIQSYDGQSSGWIAELQRRFVDAERTTQRCYLVIESRAEPVGGWMRAEGPVTADHQGPWAPDTPYQILWTSPTLTPPVPTLQQLGFPFHLGAGRWDWDRLHRAKSRPYNEQRLHLLYNKLGQGDSSLNYDVLNFCVGALSLAPCGLEHRTIDDLAKKFFSHRLPDDVDHALIAVLWGWLPMVGLISSGQHPGGTPMLRSAAVPDELIVGVGRIDDLLIDEVQRRMGERDWSMLLRRVGKLMEASSHRGVHIRLMKGFLDGDLRPFVESTCRDGVVLDWPVKDWLGRHEARPRSHHESFIERFLWYSDQWVESAVQRKTPPDPKTLGPAPRDSALCEHLLDVAQFAFGCLKDGYPNLTHYLNRKSQKRPDVAAEALCWLVATTCIRRDVDSRELFETVAMMEVDWKRLSDVCALMLMRYQIGCTLALGPQVIAERISEVTDLINRYFSEIRLDGNFWRYGEVDAIVDRIRPFLE